MVKYSKTCRRRNITRKGYVRHRNGITIRVRSGCIKAQSQTGKKRTTIDKRIMKREKKVHVEMRKEYGTPHCKEGEVVMEGYKRNAYTRKNGVHVAATHVPPICIKATGKSKKTGRKGKQLFVLEKGLLAQYGYHGHIPESDRHTALNVALLTQKPLSVYRKLNALYVLNKNRHPSLAHVFREDAEWVKNSEAYKNRTV